LGKSSSVERRKKDYLARTALGKVHHKLLTKWLKEEAKHIMGRSWP